VGWGGSKSDSKAFGRLLCSRPKAKKILVEKSFARRDESAARFFLLGAAAVKSDMYYTWTLAALPYTSCGARVVGRLAGPKKYCE
jgi:hypothetical protein